MSEYKKVRTFLSSLDESQFQFLNIQMSLANDAKLMMSTFGLSHEQFGDLMKLNQRQIDKYLNGSYNYTLMDTAKMKANWHMLEMDYVMNNTHEVVKIATEINDLQNLKSGDWVQCKVVDSDDLTIDKKYQIIMKQNHKVESKKYVFVIIDNFGIQFSFRCDTKSFIKCEPDEEKLINPDDEEEKRFTHTTSSKKEGEKYPYEVPSLENYDFVKCVRLVHKDGKILNNVTVQKSYEICSNIYGIKHGQSSYFDIYDDFNEIISINTKSDNFVLVEKEKIITLDDVIIGENIIVNNTVSELEDCITPNKEYTVVDFEDVHSRKHLVIFDDSEEKLFVPISSGHWKPAEIETKNEVVDYGENFDHNESISYERKPIPEDTGNFKGKYIIHATHLEKGDELICVNEITEHDPDAKFTYAETYTVSKESVYHGTTRKEKDYITVLDDNKKEVHILLTSKQFVYPK